MSKNQLWPKAFVKCTRRNPVLCSILGNDEHYSTAWLEVPWEIAHSGDPLSISLWVAEGSKYTWMAGSQCVECHNQDHIDDLLSEAAK
tara:strand:+ start:705 stop:968 length:264 start_codon:yes stop_codon:yes gene_type:complete